MGRPVLCIPLLLLACTDIPLPEEGAESAPVIESTTSLWSPTLRTPDPEPLLRIGTAQGDGPDAFGTLGSVRLLPRGLLGATDSQAAEIRIFDMSGSHVATLGRDGAGPDEFRSLGRIYPYPGDSVAAFDFGLGRTLVFPLPSGPSRVITGLFEGNRAPVLGVLNDGSLLAYQAQPPVGDVGVWDTTAVLHLDRSGESARVLGRLPSREGPVGPENERRVLGALSIFAAAPDGFYWARTDEYAISFFDTGGTLQRVQRLPIDPEPLTESARDDYLEASVRSLRNRGGQGADRLEAQLRNAQFADTRPLFFGAFVDWDQRLWISSWPWPSRYEPSLDWTVFDREGRWLGRVQAPPGVTIVDARGDTLVGIWRDEFDVAYVQLHLLDKTN